MNEKTHRKLLLGDTKANKHALEIMVVHSVRRNACDARADAPNQCDAISYRAHVVRVRVRQRTYQDVLYVLIHSNGMDVIVTMGSRYGHRGCSESSYRGMIRCGKIRVTNSTERRASGMSDFHSKSCSSIPATMHRNLAQWYSARQST